MAYEDFVDIVDTEDRVVGRDTQLNKFAKELISRNVAVFIRDSQARYMIVKRAPHKRSFPNRLDLAACGNVDAGETYEQAAAREVREELGIECPLQLLDKIFNEYEENGKMVRYFTGVFLGTYDGEIRLNDEVSDWRKFTLEELRKLIGSNPDQFTPFFLQDFKMAEDRL